MRKAEREVRGNGDEERRGEEGERLERAGKEEREGNKRRKTQCATEMHQ